MNHRNRNLSTAQQRQQIEKRASSTQTPPESESEASPIFLFIRILLAVFALVMASLFVSFLFAEFHFSYSTCTPPSFVNLVESNEPSGRISEADIPVEESAEPLLYDFSLPVPEATAQPIDFFNDTVFIGDSRTEGLILYTKLSPIDFSSVGINVKTVMQKDYIRLSDENGNTQNYRLLEALEALKGTYKAIYIAIGLNELGWDVKQFAESYRSMIEAIRNIADIPIYIQLILPVTTQASETSKFGITNEKASIFNNELRTLAEELELFLLDTADLFLLEDGTLNPDVAYDGIHLTPNAYAVLVDFYCTHVVDIEKYDNLRATEENVDLSSAQ